MAALLPLSFQRLGTTRNPRPSLTNAERLQAYRMAVEPMLGNYWPWKFTQVYGGGGVEVTRTAERNVCQSATARGPAQPASDGSRYRILPASTLPARGPDSLTLSPEGGDSGATDGDMK